jgi:NADPH-dependent curcumin reductase CurA
MRIKVQGFIVIDHIKDFPEARQEIAQWVEAGSLKKSETIIKGGLKNAEQALVDLFKGINTGMFFVPQTTCRRELLTNRCRQIACRGQGSY